MTTNTSEPDNIDLQENVKQNTLIIPKASNTLTITFPNQDLISLQNDLLSKISSVESLLVQKIKEIESSTSQTFSVLSSNLSELNVKINSLTQTNAEQKNKIVKIDDFISLKRKAEEQLITHEIRINNTMKDLANAQFKYDKLFTANLTVPGYVGECSQFKTIAEYIDYNIKLVDNLVTSRDKMQNEFKQNKQYTEMLIKDNVKLIENNVKRCNEYTDKKTNEIVLKISDNKNDTNEKFMNVRVENAKIIKDINTNFNEFKNEWNQLLKIKEEIYNKLTDHLYIYKTDFNLFQKRFNDIHKEFTQIKGKYDEVTKFIKENRFRRTFGTVQMKNKESEFLLKKIKENNDNNNTHKRSLSINFNKSNDNINNVNTKEKENDNQNRITKPKEDEHDKLITKQSQNINEIQKNTNTPRINNNNNTNNKINLKQISQPSQTKQKIMNDNLIYQNKLTNMSLDDLSKKTSHGQIMYRNQIQKTNPLFMPLKTHSTFKRMKIDPIAKLVEFDFDNCSKFEKRKESFFAYKSPQHFYQEGKEYLDNWDSNSKTMRTINTSRNKYKRGNMGLRKDIINCLSAKNKYVKVNKKN